MKRITAISPTRVDLAGGTLDLWPLWSFYGPAKTINISINIFTQAELVERSDKRITVSLSDIGWRREFKDLSEALACQEREFSLFQNHIDFWKPSAGFDLTTKSDSPVGGGLGGSSSLSISLIKVFSKWLEEDLNPYEMVTIAKNLEAKTLNTLTGVQDYYPAIEGGLHILEFTQRGSSWRRLTIPEDIFNAHMLLVYTGKPHQSGINNWQVLKLAVDRDPHTTFVMKGLKEVADEMATAVEKGSWSRLPELLKREFDVRSQLTASFMSPEIERLNRVALPAGAQAVKICGAGGGGCCLVWCPEGFRGKVERACLDSGFQVLSQAKVVAKVDPVRVENHG